MKKFNILDSEKEYIYNFYAKGNNDFPEQKQTNNLNFSEVMNRINSLFSEELKKITFLIWGMWFAMTFVFYGQTFILPILLSKFPSNTSDSIWEHPFAKIIIPIFAEIPASFLCAFLIDQPRFGRQKLIIFAFSLSALAYFFCCFSSHFSFVIYLSVARFFLVIGYSVKYTYTSEVYHTNIRSTGVGAASGFGRVGGIFMPFVLLQAVEINVYLPFVCFFIICIFGGICTYLFPYDTFNKELDT
jgi:putative MFS transporter